MQITPYHAKYFAHELTRHGGKGVERLSRSLFDACVDLNPHQIEAALFALRSPVSKGVLLADEVGLGKTIEAGLVLCQYWAERRRRLLVICPASIRKQWALELEEKFNLYSKIIDAKSYSESIKNGNLNPFEDDAIIITSILTERIIEDEEINDELLDEILEGENKIEIQEHNREQSRESESEKVMRKKLNEEIEELGRYIQLAESIGIDTKTKALLKALDIGFQKMSEMGALQKAIIFTESVKTQMYLKDFLESNGYVDKVVTFNGTNRTPESTQIYGNWVESQKDLGRVTGSRPVDVRMAILEYFKNKANIMIATEAGAEGINLQFCSLVINFDLPWNPQRIEQRIGRCHRYGQKHDVVVINFLNQKNKADCRVYELLNSKFNLFTGVFGASDEVLGSIESGVDFEKRIFDIYQQCRTVEEIEAAFNQLQKELDDKIKNRINDTRRILIENFDEDVHARLKVNLDGAREQLDNIGRMFWKLTKFILSDMADFNDKLLTFYLKNPPVPEARSGTYHMISKSHENISGAYLYRLSHPLGEHVIESGKNCKSSKNIVKFDISNHPARISVIEALKGRSGWLLLNRLKIQSFDETEYLLFSGFDDNGISLDQETCEKLFHCNGTVEKQSMPEDIPERLFLESDRHAKATINRALEENSKHFNEARERLEKWADDMVIAAEKELKDTKAQIKTLNRQSRQAENLELQHKIQERIKQLEKKKRRQRQQIFDIEDEIMEKRDNLIDALEKRLEQKTAVDSLFTIRWVVV